MSDVHPVVRWLRAALARSALILIAFSLVLVLPARPASAHAALLFTGPAADGAVPTSPTELSLTFDSQVALPAVPVVLTDPAGRRVPLGRPAMHKSVVTVPVSQRLGPGVYTVVWQVAADDGDAVTGRYRFAVGPGAPGSALTATGYVSPPAAAGFWPTTIGRWLVYAALAVALGGAAAGRLARRRSDRAGPKPWIRPAAIVGGAASGGLALIVAGGGNLLEGAAQPGNALDGRAGAVAVVQIAAFAVAGLAWPRLPKVAVAALLAVVAAEAVRGHPQAASPLWGALLIAVHLLAVALWIGALLHVVRTALAWRDQPGQARLLFADYARWALWLFAVVVVTGTVTALLIIPLDAVVTTGYGRTLLLKLALVAAAATLALTARRRLRRGPGHRTARIAGAESGVLAAVLAATALLVTIPPPVDANRPLPVPPPPSGPVRPLGALAGAVSISATASTGQLVVHLFVPGSDDPAAAPGDAPVQIVSASRAEPRYQLTAALADPTGKPQQLRLRRCGTGCFVAPAAWADGTSQLTLRTTVTDTPLGTVGGTVALAVAWPPAPDTGALRRALDAMRQTSRFTLYERTTSDTARGPGELKRLVMDGRRFLDSQPYRANAPVVLRDGADTLTVALPAERIQARLTLDNRGRIIRETLTAPRYLITRTFVYP